MAKYKFLGFTIGKDDEEVPEERLQPFSLPDNQDAAIDVQGDCYWWCLWNIS